MLARGGDHTHDELFRATAEIQPWFGGLYVENGELRVVSTDPTIALSTVSAVAAGVLNAAGSRDLAQRAGGVQVMAGDHSFVALNDWLVEIRPVLHEHGVHSVSIDEVANSIRPATEFSQAAVDLRDRVREKAIPESAVTVDVRERARFNHTYGGQEVTIRFPGFVSDAGTCTLTQVVEHRLPDGSLDSDLYGITNSHCTQDFGQAFGDRFMSGQTGVATEVWTHPMFTNLLSACGVVEPEERLRFDAEVTIAGDTVHYTLWVENPTAKTVELHSGGCIRGRALRVYDLPGPGRLLRWDGTIPPPGVPCFGDRSLHFFPPGVRHPLAPGFATVQQILGDSLPEGPYQLSVVPVFEQDLSHREVSVGGFTLER